MDSRGVKENRTTKVNEPSRRTPLSPRAQAHHQQVQELLDLADELQRVLVPVEPSAYFRQRLRNDLRSTAQRRRLEAETGLFRQHRRGILIGAALGSAASIVGVVVAFVLHYRHSRATHMATS